MEYTDPISKLEEVAESMGVEVWWFAGRNQRVELLGVKLIRTEEEGGGESRVWAWYSTAEDSAEALLDRVISGHVLRWTVDGEERTRQMETFRRVKGA